MGQFKLKAYRTFLLVFMLTGNSVLGQNHFMVEGGLQFPYFKAKAVNKDEISSSPVSNITVGILYNIALIRHLSVEPGLFFSGKGGKVVEKDFSGKLTDRIYTNYAEVPVNFSYRLLRVKGNSLLAGAGPYLAKAVGGKEKTEIILKDSTIAQKSLKQLMIGNKDGIDVIRPWDFGFNFFACMQFKWGIYVRVSYCLGLPNIYPTSRPSDYSFRQRSFSLCLGYGIPN